MAPDHAPQQQDTARQHHDAEPSACDALPVTGWRSELRGTTPDPQPASDRLPAVLELEKLRAELPGYRIWREVNGEHIRLVAVARTPGASPHTVVADDHPGWAVEREDGQWTAWCPAITVHATTSAGLRALIEQAITDDGQS